MNIKKIYAIFLMVSPKYFFLLLSNQKLSITMKDIEDSFHKNKNSKRYLLNFYNFFVFGDFQNALFLINSYFESHHLAVLEKINYHMPLYINNIKIKNSLFFETIKQQTISIIITTHNEEELIGSATESLLLQYFKNIEIIFVDDASNDKTISIFNSTCTKYNFTNYKIIILKENSGPFVAKNIGLIHATGDYITFHDADDWAHPKRLQAQVEKIETDEAVASISRLVRIKENGELFSKHIYPLDRMAMVSLMFKREVFKTLGYFYTDKLGADSEYYERVKYFYGESKVDNIKKVLTFAAHRPNSRTTSIETGTPGFGENPLRLRHTEDLQERLFEMVNSYRNYYVPFDVDAYNFYVVA